MQVTVDIFEKLCCLMAFISMVAYAGGTHTWTLAICFFGIFAVQKDNYKMMFPFVLYHIFGTILDIIVVANVGGNSYLTFATIFIVINILVKIFFMFVWYQLYTKGEGSLDVPFNGANLPVAKQWNPNQQGAPQQGSQTGPDQQQGGNSDKPYNAPVVQHTDL